MNRIHLFFAWFVLSVYFWMLSKDVKTVSKALVILFFLWFLSWYLAEKQWQYFWENYLQENPEIIDLCIKYMQPILPLVNLDLPINWSVVFRNQWHGMVLCKAYMYIPFWLYLWTSQICTWKKNTQTNVNQNRRSKTMVLPKWLILNKWNNTRFRGKNHLNQSVISENF